MTWGPFVINTEGGLGEELAAYPPSPLTIMGTYNSFDQVTCLSFLSVET